MLRVHVLSSRAELDPWLAPIEALMAEEALREDSRLLVQEPSFYRRYCGDLGLTIVGTRDGVLVGVTLLAFGDAIHTAFDETIRELGISRCEVAVGLQSLIAPGWRRRGFARMLLDARKVAAQARGIRWILSTTDPENESMLVLKRAVGGRELARRRVYSSQVMRVILVEELGS